MIGSSNIRFHQKGAAAKLGGEIVVWDAPELPKYQNSCGVDKKGLPIQLIAGQGAETTSAPEMNADLP